MSPEDRLRALRDDARWESGALAPERLPGTGRTPRDRIPLMRVLVTGIVAVLVVVGSIGVLRVAADRGNRGAAGTPSPAPTATPSSDGATAVIRGTAPTSRLTIAGAGRPGGPDAAELLRLRGLADRLGVMTGQPDASTDSDARLASAQVSVRKAFGSAVHDSGGTGPGITEFFLVLNRTPTPQERQLLRLLPFTVRLSWGPRLSIRERDRQQQAAFAGVRHALSAFGNTEPETDTQTFSYWPDRDHPQTAAQIAEQMAATIQRLSGAPPTFSIEVTDRSRTAAGLAAQRAVGHPLSDTGVRLLIAERPTDDSFGGVGTGGRYGRNLERCVALGDAVVIAPPGSSIAADGRSIRAKGLGTYPVSDGATADPLGKGFRGDTSGGGTYLDAKAAASYLPRGSTLCGAKEFLLIGQ